MELWTCGGSREGLCAKELEPWEGASEREPTPQQATEQNETEGEEI